ncbi:MAG TPA: hypothetical protein VIV55_10065 [Flavobacterium sp.]
MKNLSEDIEYAVSNCIDILNYKVDITEIKSDKIEAVMKSKTDSFVSCKELIVSWQNSINSPADEKLEKYIIDLVRAGENSIEVLRKALRKKINPLDVDPERHGAATKAKPLIFKAINEINAGVIELKLQLESGKFNLSTPEFKRGYPERFANQEFYALKHYHKEWYDAATDSIMICPLGTKGEIITLDNLNIMLPKQPNRSEILFNKHRKEDQYWRRIEPPTGLIAGNEDQYADFILQEFKRRRQGVFFFNNGSAVYLTPAHYMGLQWNQMKDTGGYKEFRYAQAKMYYFTQACIVDPRCLGELFVKGRRTGFTEEILDHFINDSTSTKNALLGMTSKTGDDGAAVFEKYSYGIQNLPFFFIPVVKGKIDDTQKMLFGKVSENTKEAKKKKETSTNDYLNTRVDFMNATTLAYDSKKLFRYLLDEGGKRERPQNVIDHLDNVRPTMITGGRVVGKCFAGSTLNPKEKGGAEYETLYYGSDVTKRNANGRTTTGLYSFFLPAHKNYEDFTDKYGVCHEMVSPGEFFYNAQGVKMTQGSLQFLQNEFAAAKLLGSKVYNNRRRLDPITIEDAFRDELSTQLLNTEKINQQLNFNRNTNIDHTLVRGNFEWKDGIRNTTVIWKPNDKGRFLVSWIPDKELQNQFVIKPNGICLGHSKFPVNVEMGSFGVDPYDQTSVVNSKLITTENGQEYNIGSKGSIHGLTGFNLGNIPSNYFFLEYIARPKEADIFFDDALMACVFYGMPILVENNKKMLLKHFKVNGYRGFCLNRFDKEVNRLSADEKELGGLPNTSADIINQHWTAIEKYIEDYVGEYDVEEGQDPIREVGLMGSMPFNRTLQDWLGFKVEDRTKYDASISSGLAIMAVNRHKYKHKNLTPEKVTIRIRKYVNSNNN